MVKKTTKKRRVKKNLTFWERVARGWTKFFQSTGVGGN
jgi:hypothetical protein